VWGVCVCVCVCVYVCVCMCGVCVCEEVGEGRGVFGEGKGNNGWKSVFFHSLSHNAFNILNAYTPLTF